MKTQPIGASPLVSSRLAYGCLRILGTLDPKEVTPQREAAGRAAVRAAYEAGYTLFDHADIYCGGECERVFGQALREISGMRERIVIATKCGIVFAGRPNPDSPYRYDFSPEHIIRSCEQSLKRLGVATIDLYQLHRPDLLMDPAAVAEAFDSLRASGKVRYFGVSNFAASTLVALQKACPFPLIVNQIEVHLGRLAPFADGTVDQCLAERITPLSWSPLGGGFLATAGKPDPTGIATAPAKAVAENLLKLMDDTAKRYGTTRTAIALAWLLKHPAGIIPIVGSGHPDRLREATKADDVDLAREDWYRLLTAARGERLP